MLVALPSVQSSRVRLTISMMVDTPRPLLADQPCGSAVVFDLARGVGGGCRACPSAAAGTSDFCCRRAGFAAGRSNSARRVPAPTPGRCRTSAPR
jgi:hypothetical protein